VRRTVVSDVFGIGICRQIAAKRDTRLLWEEPAVVCDVILKQVSFGFQGLLNNNVVAL
jgi:hypothetical protein